ncbi:TolC family protein [Legionella maioricensis]|uniref:TolC family protein n=1 Tax=Legionella maioricensis TaxID=2896528 RepID=A0A9X2D2J2_9GAMM|nr:TolC family protein [Legionella maioricensis]MCL9684870.1 TolC family protein [Legionella maioricensis]MCL9688946.1 TolC family protein [Legionella maioricensis]
MWRLINCVLLPLILAGCLQKNTYHKPDVKVVNKWTVADRNISTSDEKNIPYMAWWQGFNDPTLNRLIKRGLRCNTSLNMSRGSIEAAEGELKKIRYQWIPTADVMFGYSRNPATGFPGVLGVIIPSYIINIFHQIKEQKKAKYTLAQIKAEDDALKLTIIAEITASYFTYQAERERKQLLKILANDLMQLAEISRQVYKGGLTSDIEQQELFSQAKVIRGEQEVIEKNIIISRNAIRYLINLNPGDIKTTVKFLDLNNKQLIPGALPLTVLENRPDLQMAENRLRASNEAIGLAASNFLPTITLDLIGGKAAGDSKYNWPRKNVYFNDQLLRTPLLKMSVLGEIANARGLDRVSYFNYVDTLQKALRDTTNALSANERFTNKLKQTQEAQRYLAKSYELNRRLYKRGIQNYVDMLKTKIILDRININLNEDKLRQLLTVVSLYQELAGGYRANELLPITGGTK